MVDDHDGPEICVVYQTQLIKGATNRPIDDTVLFLYFVNSYWLCMIGDWTLLYKKSLMTSRIQKPPNRRMIDSRMAKIKRTKSQTMMYKPLHRKKGKKIE